MHRAQPAIWGNRGVPAIRDRGGTPLDSPFKGYDGTLDV
jgi:hypothetical protein